MTEEQELLKRWRLIRPYLNKRQQGFWAGAEALVIGWGGAATMSRVTDTGSMTISKRSRELQQTRKARAGSLSQSPKSRCGRKMSEVRDPGLAPALERLLANEIAGDPMTNQRWVRSSLRNLSRRLQEQGHQACTHVVARLLRRMGYSLRVNKRKQAGAQHPERDTQFKYIASMKEQYIRNGLPVISIDTKKKELIGNYRRDGRIWTKGSIEVEHHFASYAQCVAVPFGVYDVNHNTGFVAVGISHNTAEFAVNCLLTWWRRYGQACYPHCDQVLILADGGGGNGYNLRCWNSRSNL